MKASVIIPTYNRAEYVVRILATLNEGTVLPEEVILVDDSPNWMTAQGIATLEALRFELVYIKRPDLGFRVASARRMAIAAAKNEIIIAIQDATLPSLKLVETYVGLLDTPDWRIVYGYVLNDPNVFDSDDRHSQWVQGKLWAHGWGRNLAFQRELALKVGSYDPLFDGAYGFEDVDFSYRMERAGAKAIVSQAAWCTQLPRAHRPDQRDQGGQLSKFVMKNGVWP